MVAKDAPSWAPTKLITIVAFTLSAIAQIQGSSAATADSIWTPDHVVIVVEENHDYSGAEGLVGFAGAPYINSFVSGANTAGAAVFTQSYALTHPSQPNYLQLFSGDNQGVTNDAVPTNLPFTTPNLGAALLGHGLSFAAYSEDLPSVGFTGAVSTSPGTYYARKHCPWVNWQESAVNGIPAAANQPFTSFPSDYNALPTVSFVIPNLIDDMHNAPPSGGSRRTAGDRWLLNKLDGYIQWAKTHNSLFILTFDEDSGSQTGTEVQHIFTMFVGAGIQSGLYGERVDHYNVLRTLEEMYHLDYVGQSASSTPILDVYNTSVTNAHHGTWSGASGGAWNTAANWNSGVGPGLDPNFPATDAATFGLTSGNVTVDLVNASPSLNSIAFNSIGSYSLVAGGSGGITLAGASAAISDAGAHVIAAPLTLAADVTVNVNSSSDLLTISGEVSGNHQLTSLGAGTLVLTGPRAFGAGAALSVGGTGTVRINATAAGSVAAGAIVTVGSTATLELDGSMSALVDPTALITTGLDSQPTRRAGLKNDGTLSIVSTGPGQTQEVGGIDPNTGAGGSVVINANAGLIADHIIQDSLFIGTGATFTIAPSDSRGDPMAALGSDSGLALAGALGPSSRLVASSAGLLGVASPTSATRTASLGREVAGASVNAVSEPTTAMQVMLGALMTAWSMRRRRRQHSK